MYGLKFDQALNTFYLSGVRQYVDFLNTEINFRTLGRCYDTCLTQQREILTHVDPIKHQAIVHYGVVMTAVCIRQLTTENMK